MYGYTYHRTGVPEPMNSDLSTNPQE